jgi:hypothetical protein
MRRRTPARSGPAPGAGGREEARSRPRSGAPPGRNAGRPCRCPGAGPRPASPGAPVRRPASTAHGVGPVAAAGWT